MRTTFHKKQVSPIYFFFTAFITLSFLQSFNFLNAAPHEAQQVNPSVAEFFQYRDNHQQFKQLKATLGRHITETQQLLTSLEQESRTKSKKLGQTQAAAHSQLESKIEELELVQQELGKSHFSGLESSIGTQIDSVSQQLGSIKNSKNDKERTAKIQQLRSKLQSYQTFKVRNQPKVKSSLEPNGWSSQPIPKPVELLEKEQTTPISSDKPLSLNKPKFQRKNSDSPLALLSSTLQSLVDFVLPSAAAAEYQQPAILPGALSCYADQADYDAHINQDMDLSQPELEVDQSLDPTAYAKITALAAELEYSPVKILEYVTNNLEHEHYLGSVKGALGVLTSGGGNDTDHASLVIALLRASGIPARYVRGQIYLQDKPAHLDWWNVKDFEAAKGVVAQATGTYPNYQTTVDGVSAFSTNHVWVEACVPYGNYRGNGQSGESHRWVPLDASFKRFERRDGITQNETFDYEAFLSERTKKLPHEVYEEQVLEHIRSIDPNLTLADVGTHWNQNSLSLEFLPDTLPYAVSSYTNWSSEIDDSRSPALPDLWHAKVKIQLDGNDAFSIPMSDFAQHRITLSFVGANSTYNTKYLEFIDGDRTLDCGANNLVVRPVFKKDGAPVTIIDGDTVTELKLSSLSICDDDDFQKITMKVKATVNNTTVSATGGPGNYIEFDTISPLDVYAMSAYPFNASDTYLEERSSRLLHNLASVSKPSEDIDGTTGEFLHLVLSKYMRYITDAAAGIGQLLDSSGRSGHHIGVASTHADVEYVFDLPYAMHSNNFVVDVPGGLSKSVAITGGGLTPKVTRLSGYTASHYESYIWQEMALKDAVSTVSGLQIASSENNEVRSFTDSSTLSSFINTCTSQPDTTSWPSNKPLAQMVTTFRAAGFHNSYDESLKDFFIANNGYFTSYSTETQIDNALAADFLHCYPQDFVTNVINSSFLTGYTNKVTISKYPVSYRKWLGPVFATESIKDDGTSSSFGFPIASWAGGYTVPTVNPTIYSSSPSGSSSSVPYSTGFDIPASVSNTSTSNTNSTAVDINSGNNTGVSTHSVTAFDPVNMVTGNMYHEETDFSIPTRGLPFLFNRTYNSSAPEDGPLGWGWTHSFNQTVEFFDTNSNTKSDTIVWTDSTGSKKYIELDESVQSVNGILNITPAKVTIPDGFYFTLQRPYTSGAINDIEIREKSGITYHFSPVYGSPGSVAKLTRLTDRNGHTLNLSYSNNKLTKVTDPDNRSLVFLYYDNTDRIKSITPDWDDTIYEYFYDTSDNLSAYRSPQDRVNGIDTTTYSYYDSNDGPNLNHRLESFTYANGYQMTFEYYINGKAYRHTNAEGESATFSYNDFRRESTTIDEKGRLQRYIFNENGLPVEITDTVGGKELYIYDDPNDPMLRTKVIDAMGYETQYSYDTNANLIQTTLPSGDTVVNSYYNGFGQPQLIKNAAGNYTLRFYDAAGNLTDTIAFTAGFGSAINPATFVPEANASNILSWTTMSYDGNGKLIESRQAKDFTDPASGPWTTLEYTDTENSTQGIVPTTIGYFGDIDGDGIIDPDEGLGSYETSYDPQGRVLNGFNGALYPVKFYYDATGRLLEETDALGGTRTYGLDSSGLVTGQSLLANIDGQVQLVDNSSALYDNANRRIVSADSSGAASYFEYDQAGNLTKATSPDGYSISFEYDDANRVIRAFDEEGNTVERTLDLIGRVKQLTDPNGNITTYSYYGPEENGRVKRITDAENRWTEFTYNATGQVTLVTDSAGHETMTDYDALGRVVRVVSPVYTDSALGAVRPVTTYVYNSLGHQTDIYGGYTNSLGQASADVLQVQARYEYDDFGRLLKKYDAANNLWAITEYDVHGNPLTSIDPMGHTTTSTYGFGGILESQTTTGPAGTESITYEHNPLGQPTQISSNNVTYTYQYDVAHRLQKVTDSRGDNFIEYDYSIGGLLNSITDNHGNSAAYLYDPVGRLTGIRTPDQGLISYVYDAGGRLIQKAFPNDLTTGYAYFKDNRVKSITTTNGSTELINNQYTYNASGDTATASLALSGVTQNRSYTYDGLGRLVKEIDADNDVDLDQLSYDPFGNRRTRTTDGTTYYYNHNSLHQIEDIRTGSGAGTVVGSFSYDTNGNMTGKTFTGETTTIGYDALDRVVSVAKGGLDTEQYGYDHGIRRISKTVGSTTTNYHYSGPDILGEYSTDWSTPLALYAHGAAMDDPLVRIVGGTPSYYHGDGLGSVVGMSNSSGALVATNRYGAWGNVVESTGVTPQYGYTGREPDATGLVYYRARYYDPQIGRFTQPDPKGFIDGLNQYTYVMNSPVNYVDPWGMKANNHSNTLFSDGAWSKVTSTVSTAWNHRHDILAAGGMTPGIGFVADIADAGLYAIERDWKNFGFATGAILPGAGQGVRGLQYGAKYADEVVDMAIASKGGENLITVRHHTSPSSLQGIKSDNAINPGRGTPTGVHVEIAPFGKVKSASADTGAFGKGAYVEFQVPKSSVHPTNVGPRNTGVISSNNPISLQGTKATFKKKSWWKFWE